MNPSPEDRGRYLATADSIPLAPAVRMKDFEALRVFAQWQTTEIDRLIRENHSVESERDKLQALLDCIVDGARWRGWEDGGVGHNVDFWSLPNCDGRKGALIDAARATERARLAYEAANAVEANQ